MTFHFLNVFQVKRVQSGLFLTKNLFLQLSLLILIDLIRIALTGNQGMQNTVVLNR